LNGTGPWLVIAPDKEAAAYLHNTLSAIYPEADVMLLPDSFKRPGVPEEIVNSQVMERTEALNRLYHNSRSPQRRAAICAVSYPEALIEAVIAPEAIARQQIRFVKGESIRLDDLLALLIEMGFERVDFVYEPGQFSIRGGIIDIFSFGHEWPYRIELFDDDVVSIRLLDPLGQLAQRNQAEVHIIPNDQTQFDTRAHQTVWEALAEEVVVWIEEPGLLIDRYQALFEKLAAIKVIDI